MIINSGMFGLHVLEHAEAAVAVIFVKWRRLEAAGQAMDAPAVAPAEACGDEEL